MQANDTSAAARTASHARTRLLRCIVLRSALSTCILFVQPLAQACAPPVGFLDTAPPSIAEPIERLVSRTEEIVIDRPLQTVLSRAAASNLEATIDRSSSLPGVSGTYMLTPGEYGAPGSRRITCLTDGSTLVEQVLERVNADGTARFRYVVWNYTSPRARAIEYGVGHFIRTDLGDGHTRVHWTYSFQLNRRRFPGFLGPIGDFLFRKIFLDREYAAMMRGTLAGDKARAEALPGV